MINDKERDRLSKLPAADKPKAIQDQIDRIHRAVNTGSPDRDAVNDALDRLVAITGTKVPAAVKPSKPLAVA